MPRKAIMLSVIGVAVVAGLLVLVPRLSFYTLTGRFSPVDKVETLHNPIAVTQWGADGLSLADGRKVQIPGVRSLPTQSPALAEATKRGVEVGSDGRVWALVKVHHWCGNDPVRNHIARVDLADMLIFLRVGEPTVPVREGDFITPEPGGRFTEWGWNISEFSHFYSWQRFKDAER